MGRHSVGSIRYGLVAAALTAALLTGCSSGNFGSPSSYGGKKAELVQVADIGTYTSDRAMVEGSAHFGNNDFGYSAAFFKRAVELSPKDPRGYVGLGASYDQLGRFDLSDRVYASLYKLTGGTAQYYNNLGYSYMLRGNLTAALTNFRRAKAIEPDNIVVANNLQILADAAASARA